MLIGYMRVSKSDGSQTFNLQRDALIAAGIDRVMWKNLQKCLILVKHFSKNVVSSAFQTYWPWQLYQYYNCFS
jgi:hypothetical protein